MARAAAAPRFIAHEHASAAVRPRAIASAASPPTRPNKTAPLTPTRVGPVHIVQIACWQAALAGMVAAVGRPPALLALAGFLAVAIFAVTAVRVRGRWVYEWLGIATRYTARRRRWAATPTTLSNPKNPNNPENSNNPTTPEPAILAAVSPGARIGRIDLDEPARVAGVVTHEGGLTAVLEISPDTDAPTALPSLLALLPMVEVGESPITAQTIVETIPAPVDALRSTPVDQSYRALPTTPLPARRHGWIALQAVRTNDRPGPDVDELRTALTSAIRRTQRRLGKSGFSTRVLDPEELATTLADLGSPTDDAPLDSPMAEEWAHWRTPTCAQVTFSVVAWPDDPTALDRLSDAAGVPTVVTLGIRRTDRGVETEAAIRLIAPTRQDVDHAAAAIGVKALRRLDGEHVHGVAATLPLGGFAR